MTDMVNGSGWGTGWSLAVLGPRLLLGVGPNAKGELSPVYDVQPVMQPTQDGRLIYDFIVSPALGIVSVKALKIPAGTILISLSELTHEELKAIRKRVEMCDDLLQKLRAAASGIAIAREMPRVKS